MSGYNGLNKYQVNHYEIGMCPVCACRLTAECKHSNTQEAQEWTAAVIAAEQELSNKRTSTNYIEQVRQAAEIASDDEWLQTERRIAFDSDLGTNFTISGGEVLELDGVRIPKALIDAQMKRDEEDMPF